MQVRVCLLLLSLVKLPPTIQSQLSAQEAGGRVVCKGGGEGGGVGGGGGGGGGCCGSIPEAGGGIGLLLTTHPTNPHYTA